MTTRVLIADDHRAFRTTCRALLARDGFEVVAEAENGVQALRLARELRPDLVLLDIGLPDVDGFEVATRLAADGAPAPRVILTSNRDFSGFTRPIAESGALGFLPKHELSGPALRALLGAAAEVRTLPE